MDELKTDCRHFRSDRPCAPHKQHGVICATCTEHYDPIATRILIVKLAAIGDVLRTTCLLPAIHRRWPGAHVTWVTAPASLPLFDGNPMVDRALGYHGHLPVQLAAEQFDVILNADAAADSCALAHAARGKERLGFDLDETRGVAVPLSDAAARWFEMGVRDDLKKANTRTYQDLMSEVLGLDYDREPPTLELTDTDRARGTALRSEHAPARAKIVGLNTGAGGRWHYKKWTEDGYGGLIERLTADGHAVFLLGGPEEVERNRRLAAGHTGVVVDTGCDNSLRDFAGIVDVCDAVVTGDTLAMHVAIARSVPVVVLFGPTSLNEIEVFDRGTRIAPDLDCLVCYKQECDFVPNCMESISVAQVHESLLRVMESGDS